MKAEYDFSNSTKNPYFKKLKRQITIRIDSDTIEYFKKLSEESGIPYQNLINLYLSDCASKHKKIDLAWN
jgi:predicted DNA binding CopG/RHH family protein